MKQLTRKEIVELIAWQVSKNKLPENEIANRILTTLEKAGVLMLVEEGSAPKESDLCRYADPGNFLKYSKMMSDSEGESKRRAFKEYLDIIQRANTPVYQCAKETINNPNGAIDE